MLYTFADIEIDTLTLELRRRSVVQPVEPLVFGLLRVLIENRHRVVTKSELLQQVWQDRIVSDSTIAGAVKVARQLIGDDGKEQRLIRTFSRRGYRFVGEIIEHDDPSSSETLVTVLPGSIDTSVSNDKKSQIKEQLAKSDCPSIAVLPFEMRVQFNRFPIIADAIAHDISRGLSRLRWLHVIATASTSRFRSAETTIDSACHALGARYYLTGSVETRGDKLLLAVELVDSGNMKIIWAESFEGLVEQVDSLRSEVTGKAIAMIEQQIPISEANIARLRSPDDLDAWAAFYLGLINVNRFTPEGTLVAVDLFHRAIKLEPGLARAHAALSFAHFQQAFNRYPDVNAQHASRLAAECADRGMELDEFDPFCNFARGRVSWLSGEVEQGFVWLDRAIEINPNFAQGYYSRALAAVLTGSPYDVHEASQRASSLSPLDPLMYGFYGIRAFEFLAAQDYDSAKLWVDKSAGAPGALVVMDLVAVAANELAGDKKTAAQWARRARSRRPNIKQELFFHALPFHYGALRNRISDALKSYSF